MRIAKLTLQSYRRFHGSTIDLETPLLAVVGPNEAGKSSLLQALICLNGTQAIEPADLSRGLRTAETATVITARFALEEEDRQFALERGASEPPRWYILEKQAGGKFIHFVEPSVRRRVDKYQAALGRLDVVLKSKQLAKLLSEPSSPQGDDGETPTARSIRESFEELRTSLAADKNQGKDGTLVLLESAIATLEEKSKMMLGARRRRTVELTTTALRELVEEWSKGDPVNDVLRHCFSERPRFLLFSDADRNLSGEYAAAALANPPAALGNLLALADLSPQSIRQALEAEDHGKRASLQEDANHRLREAFTSRWSQANVYPHIQLEPDAVRILVRYSSTYSPIAERSDGLRAFIALCSFVARHAAGQRVILLVDEAENHLHYDAQADLVRVFSEQKVARQVIYTTHSAGCLPQDLGVGVRGVRQIVAEDGSDTGQSVFINSFWTEQPGFSPLLLEMGASVFAFAPSRRAVIAEGPSEMLLLPTLLREVKGAASLPFQVAPGVATVSQDNVAALDLEAPRVGFLVDGDRAGKKLASKLRKGGVEPASIVSLPEDHVLEDFLNADVYAEALTSELKRSHSQHLEMLPKELPEKGRPAFVEAWCRLRGIPAPRKVRVAYHILWNGSGRTLVDRRKRSALVRVYETLCKVLLVSP